MTRCYSSKWHEKYPTYIGCSICKEWHNYQNFGDWYDENYPKNPRKGVRYEIDKDLLSAGEKIYSPETCVIVTQQENICITHAGKYKMVSPDGEVVEIVNMSEFCRNNNLSSGNMFSVLNGDRIQHKGWRKFNG